MPETRHDAMDEVLSHVDRLGFEMGPGFSTHAPMGAEALFTLGRHAEAEPWVENYIRSVPHHRRPTPTARINPRDETDWQNARGDMRRMADWAVVFQEELEASPWGDVLARWWPRLLPGAIAGLTHGLIRTAHAVRTLSADGKPTPRQTRELADGLAYWAARYMPLPGQPKPRGHSSVQQALDAVPQLTPRQLFAAGRLDSGAQGDGLTALNEAVDQLAAPSADIDRALLNLTAENARRLRTHAVENPVPLVHTVTAPAAARMLLPYLPAETHRSTFDWVWHVSAAITAAFAGGSVPDGSAPSHEPRSEGELAGRAAEHGAAHAIKLTEACLREYRANPDPAYLLCAEDVVPRIPPDTAVDRLPGIPPARG